MGIILEKNRSWRLLCGERLRQVGEDSDELGPARWRGSNGLDSAACWRGSNAWLGLAWRYTNLHSRGSFHQVFGGGDHIYPLLLLFLLEEIIFSLLVEDPWLLCFCSYDGPYVWMGSPLNDGYHVDDVVLMGSP